MAERIVICNQEVYRVLALPISVRAMKESKIVRRVARIRETRIAIESLVEKHKERYFDVDRRII